MIRNFAIYLLLSVLITTSSRLIAQENPSDSSQTPLPTATSIPEPAPWAKELEGLEFDLAQSGYTLNQSIAGKLKLIAVSERIVNNYCIEGVSPKLAVSKAALASCKTLAEQLLVLDPSNPAAICSVKKITSKECFDAYNGIDIAIIDSSRDGLEKDLDAILTTKQDTSDFIVVENDLIFLGRALTAENSPEGTIKFEKEFSKQLQRFCTVSRLRLPATQPNSTPATPTPDQNSKPFDKMLQELSNKLDSKKGEDSTNRTTRYRLVSAPCHRILSLLNEFAPSSALSLCYRHGLYSPQCLKSRSQSAKSGASALPDGIGRF